jgi:DNA-directed RNA polymerase specialized sigma24 family protein
MTQDEVDGLGRIAVRQAADRRRQADRQRHQSLVAQPNHAPLLVVVWTME